MGEFDCKMQILVDEAKRKVSTSSASGGAEQTVLVDEEAKRKVSTSSASAGAEQTTLVDEEARPRIFLSHTGDKAALAMAIKGQILHEIPSARFWSMEDIPVGAGSRGDPKFNEIIETKMTWCSVVLGIADKSCEHSHKVWGSPAEWKMGLEQNKKVLILGCQGELDDALKNATCKEVARSVQFFPIPKDTSAESIKMIGAILKSEICQ